MTNRKTGGGQSPDPVVREIQVIKKLLMLLLIKCGATSDEVDLAVGMGASNIRAAFPIRKIGKGAHVRLERQ
jgi:hypothetical protein